MKLFALNVEHRRGETYMAGAGSDNTFQLATFAADAYARVLAAGHEIGKVYEDSSITQTFCVKTRFGLQAVKLRVTITSGMTPGTALVSVVDVSALGDVFGVGARQAMQKLQRSIR
jgi:hypothetical protein